VCTVVIKRNAFVVINIFLKSRVSVFWYRSNTLLTCNDRKIAFLLWWSRNCKFSDEKVQDQLWTNQQLESKCRNTLRKKKEEGHNACANSWVGISISFTLHQGIWTFSIWKLNSARNLKGGFHSSARVCIIYSHVHAFRHTPSFSLFLNQS